MAKNEFSKVQREQYDKPNQKSTPEWGISISHKNYYMLDNYKADIQLNIIK